MSQVQNVVPCPTCGATSGESGKPFKTVRAMKIHHGNAHETCLGHTGTWLGSYLKSNLGESFQDKETGDECEMCGATENVGDVDGLDLHHIIPMLAGGTNGDWNLITVCRSCHGKAERFARKEFAFPLAVQSEEWEYVDEIELEPIGSLEADAMEW